MREVQLRQPRRCTVLHEVRDKVENRWLSSNAVLDNPFATLRIAGQRFCDLQNAGSSPRRRILAML